MDFLKTRDRFWTALKRVHATNSAVTYFSKDESFKLMIRNDPEGGAGKYMVVDLVIVAPEDEDRVLDVLELENDGWWDDEDPAAFVVESWEFEKDAPDEDELTEMMEYVNATYKYTFCPCGKYFIKDDRDVCVFCDMTASDDDLRKESCPICLSDGYMMHMKKTACCGQIVHRECCKAWTNKSKTCALCRAKVTPDPARRGSRRPTNVVLQIDDTAIEQLVGRISRLAADTSETGTPETETPESSP